MFKLLEKVTHLKYLKSRQFYYSFEFLYQFLDVNPILEGDLNADNVIDVLDVIQAVNFILNSEYENMADLNQDNILNVLDIILYIDLILL